MEVIKKTPSRNKSVAKQGFLTKQGKKRKNWKRRWFVLLKSGVLQYFRDKSVYTYDVYNTVYAFALWLS